MPIEQKIIATVRREFVQPLDEAAVQEAKRLNRARSTTSSHRTAGSMPTPEHGPEKPIPPPAGLPAITFYKLPRKDRR